MKDLLPVLQDEHPILRKVAKDVASLTPTRKKYIKQMKKTMLHYEGVGLAAPQVGVSERVVVVCYKKGKNSFSKPEVLINPKILSFSQNMKVGEEGCLSIPDTYVNVSRYLEVEIEYLDEKEHVQKKTLFDFDARVVQHEIDHLNGVLMTDRAE